MTSLDFKAISTGRLRKIVLTAASNKQHSRLQTNNVNKSTILHADQSLDKGENALFHVLSVLHRSCAGLPMLL